MKSTTTTNLMVNPRLPQTKGSDACLRSIGQHLLTSTSALRRRDVIGDERLAG
jgi:hypothetical protein